MATRTITIASDSGTSDLVDVEVTGDSATYDNTKRQLTIAKEGSSNVNFNLKKTINGIDYYKTINILSLTKGYSLLTMTQDLNNPDPAGCLTFSNEAAGMTAEQTREWLGLKPLLFLNGIESGDLNPNDYTQLKSGGAADITTLGNDVMGKYPKRYYKISKDTAARKTIRQISTKKLDGFVEYPFIDESGTLKNAFYMGVYEGFVSNNKLYSSSGKQPSLSITFENYRTYAKNRGIGYMQLSWYQWLYYQLCYLFVHRSLNSQTAVGMGNVRGSGMLQTGTLNTRGASYGVTTALTSGVKCNYIENPWGNAFTWLDKFRTGSAGQPLVTTGPGNNTGAGYTDPLNRSNHFGTTAGKRGSLKETVDSNELGFYPYSLDGGSTSTYYSDYSYCSNTSYPIAAISGNYIYGSDAGIFYFSAFERANDPRYNSRLCYV